MSDLHSGRSEVLMNEVKYVLQLLLILPCAPQRSCSAHAFALSAHAALIAHRLSGVHHFFECSAVRPGWLCACLQLRPSLITVMTGCCCG